MSDLSRQLPEPRPSTRVAWYLDRVLAAMDPGDLEDVVASEYVLHGIEGDMFGRAGARLAAMELRRAMPDAVGVVQQVSTAGEWMVRQFRLRGTHGGMLLGIPATGRRLRLDGISVDRVIDGKLVESWRSVDSVTLLHQIGCTILAPRSDGAVDADDAVARTPG